MHETNLNANDDDEHNRDITTEDNRTEHNFINHEDIINFKTSANNQSNKIQHDCSSIIKTLCSKKGNQLQSD